MLLAWQGGNVKAGGGQPYVSMKLHIAIPSSSPVRNSSMACANHVHDICPSVTGRFQLCPEVSPQIITRRMDERLHDFGMDNTLTHRHAFNRDVVTGLHMVKTDLDRIKAGNSVVVVQLDKHLTSSLFQVRKIYISLDQMSTPLGYIVFELSCN